MEGLDDDVFTPYNMTPGHGNITGICLVFNNVHFSDPRFRRRSGSILDYHRIEKVFRCFGFQVEEKQDCTSVMMTDCLRRTAQSYSSHYCAFVCFFLSHGKEEKICDRDGRLVPLSELLSAFIDHCPQMMHKPQLFFVQICRDSEDETSTSGSPGSQSDAQKFAGIPIFPKALHILLGFATTSGREAYSCDSRGSPYIESLTRVLRERGDKDTLQEVLKITRQLVEVSIAIHNKDMCPSYISTLCRPLIFPLLRPDLRDSLIQEVEDTEGRAPDTEDLGLTLR